MNRRLDGCRPEQCREAEQPQDLGLLTLITGPEGVFESMPEGLLAPGELPLPQSLSAAQQPPGPGQEPVVGEALEDRDRRLHVAEQLVRPGRITEHEQRCTLDRRGELEPRVTATGCLIECLGQHPFGMGELTRLAESDAEVELVLESALLGHDRHGSLEQIGCGRNVSPGQCPPAGGTEPDAGAGSQGQRTVVGPQHLESQAVRTLEVIAEHLFEFWKAVARHLLEPCRVAFVEVGAKLLRHGLVGRLADENVAEAEAGDAGERRQVRHDQLLADECIEALPHLLARVAVRKRLDGARVEDVSLDCGALDCAPFADAQLVESRCEQHLDRRGDGELLEAGVAEVAAVDQHRHRLLDEERIPLGRALNPRDDALGHVHVEQVHEQLARLVLGERLEKDRRCVSLAATPARSQLE